MKILQILLITTLVTFCSQIGRTQSDDRSESPFFQVAGNQTTAQLPLLSTSATADILGPIADVTIQQKYTNQGTQPIEAVYVFPASTRAAVYHMEFKIGDRTITAKIKEKKEARSMYETAKQEGKRATLLEQFKPNVFQMNVANIMPGEIVEVVMKYTEFLIPEDQKYAFVYPKAVGPRYEGRKHQGSFVQKKGSIDDRPAFDLNVNIRTSVPITSIQCTSHKVKISQSTKNTMHVVLNSVANSNPNNDFILEYSLSGKEIESGIKTFERNGEHFFLCQMEAPESTPSLQLVPREYIFIVDVSGSMRGRPLEVSKNLMANLFSKLKPTDKFNVLFFAGSAFMLHDQSIAATENNICDAMDRVNASQGSGGTELLPALKKAMSVEKEDQFSRSFVIVTDGYVTVEEEAFRYISDHLNDANFYPFGIGGSVNRYIIEGMAHVGNSQPFIVEDISNAYKQADRLKKYIEAPVLTNIKIEGDGVELYDIVPSHIPDLTAARPIYFFGKYNPTSNGQLRISGSQGKDQFYKTMDLPKANERDAAISYLWAREKIRFIDDFNTLRYDEEKVKEVTELGLKYNLLTKYTSFIAIDSEIVNKIGNSQKSVQPTFVGNNNQLAIGFEMEIPVLLDEGGVDIYDFEIEAEDEEFVEIAELLLETLVRTEIDPTTVNADIIEVRYSKNGKLLMDKTHPYFDLILKLTKGLEVFGYDLGGFSYKMNIERISK